MCIKEILDEIFMKNNMSLLFITLILYVMSFACWFNFISSFSFVQLCVCMLDVCSVFGVAWK